MRTPVAPAPWVTGRDDPRLQAARRAPLPRASKVSAVGATGQMQRAAAECTGLHAGLHAIRGGRARHARSEGGSTTSGPMVPPNLREGSGCCVGRTLGTGADASNSRCPVHRLAVDDEAQA